MKKLSLYLAATALAAPVAAHAQSDAVRRRFDHRNELGLGSGRDSRRGIHHDQGYGCNVSVVQSDTVPAVTSVAENGEPDIVTELWLNSTGDGYDSSRRRARSSKPVPCSIPAVSRAGGCPPIWPKRTRK